MTCDDRPPGALRPLVLDTTHLVARLSRVRTSGIDKVDFAYARHFSAGGSQFDVELDRPRPGAWPLSGVAHYGLRRPRIHTVTALTELLKRWSDIPAEQGFAQAYQWLTGHPLNTSLEPSRRDPAADFEAPPSAFKPGHTETLLTALEWRGFQVRWLLSTGKGGLPKNAIYLNVAQHLLEHRRYFAWLRERPDVTSVFFVHDLIPLDYPEYFPAGYRDRFERRWRTIRDFARAIITSSACVRERIDEEFRRSNRPGVPVHVAPLPAPLDRHGVELDAELLAIPYFIVVGTIEPRKNHLLLLNIWRRMAEAGVAPKLVVVGRRGWENEQILDVLDRSRLVRPHIVELSNLGEKALARLIKNSRALLLASFAEGYGLPLVEALALGTPIIASDIPVFREVGRAAAIYKHPLDGPGWREEISRLATQPTEALMAERTGSARQPHQMSWHDYFAGIEAFLRRLATDGG